MAEAVSGERFLASVDHYTGRRVVNVKVNKSPGEDEPYWTIEFEGGAVLHNYESETPVPTAIKGAALSRTILDGKNKVTRLQFGLEEVVLNPMKYAISDPTYTKGKLVFPQKSEANMFDPQTPPDPSADRIKDGPTGDEDDEA